MKSIDTTKAGELMEAISRMRNALAIFTDVAYQIDLDAIFWELHRNYGPATHGYIFTLLVAAIEAKETEIEAEKTEL